MDMADPKNRIAFKDDNPMRYTPGRALSGLSNGVPATRGSTLLRFSMTESALIAGDVGKRLEIPAANAETSVAFIQAARERFSVGLPSAALPASALPLF